MMIIINKYNILGKIKNICKANAIINDFEEIEQPFNICSDIPIHKDTFDNFEEIDQDDWV